MLKPTISICFVNSVLFPKQPDFHLQFEPRSLTYPELVFSEQMALHLVELPKFTKTAEELTDPLDLWCYFLLHGAELDPDNLPPALQIDEVRQAVEVLRMMTQNDPERLRYEARLKQRRETNSFIKYAQDAREEGHTEGLTEGLTKGRTEGLTKGLAEGLMKQIHFCQRLLKMPLTAREELLTLPLPELQARAELLEKQLLADQSRP